jgi:hypothetical protein
MKAKTLNPHSPQFSRIRISSSRIAPYSSYVIAKLVYTEGTGFEAAEAYMPVERRVPLGAIVANYPIYREILSDWYNASFEAYNGADHGDIAGEPTLTATGYIKITGNPQYKHELGLLNEQISKLRTKKELKANK